MVGRVLVTSALEETWPPDGSPVLFLGEWCRRFDRRHIWQGLDAIVAPYHWDDRAKLHRDYLYLQSVYETTLRALAAKLNEIHGVDRSLRYWRILAGPWLGNFTQVLFDRWSMLRQAIRDHDIAFARGLARQGSDAIPADMADFQSRFIGDDWNESLCSELLRGMDVSLQAVAPAPSRSESLPDGVPAASLRRMGRRTIARIASRVSGALCRDDEYFFITSYLPPAQDFLLQTRLGQLPKLWRRVVAPIAQAGPRRREWRLQLPADSGDFNRVLNQMIPGHVPLAYVEGFGTLCQSTQSLPWPKRPRAIFTSNAHFGDDVFKAWAADMAERGVPLVIGQHGGNYGIGLWDFAAEHEITISDRFLTWGWRECESTVPVGNLKCFGRRSPPRRNGGLALLVEMSLPRTSYRMYSVPVARQWLDYFEDQCRFVEALPGHIRDHLLVRLHAPDYGWCQRERWQERYPSIRLDDGVRPLTSLIRRARLYISTYNATTFLESLSLDIPTLMFWNPKHWELRDSAVPCFEMLRSAGIFHETPESAAVQMSRVWDDVEGWWNDAQTQRVRREFCERYARIPARPLHELAAVLREVAADHSPAPVARA